MAQNEFILMADTASIIILMIMALLLCVATRFKGESSYAAMVILTTSLSDYIYNICYFFKWQSVALFTAPIAYAANLTLMPFMLFLTHRAFNPYYNFKWRALLHFLPAMAFALLVAFNINMMSIDEIANFTVARVAGFRTMLTSINFIIIVIQLVVYYYLIFSYLHKVKRFILNTRSEADLSSKVWIPRFITIIGILLITAIICSSFDPFGGFRIFHFLNVIAMSFLLYSELKIVHAIRNHKAPTPDMVLAVKSDLLSGYAKRQPKTPPVEDLERLTLFARQMEEYLSTSETYCNPHLSLNDIAKATGISSKNLSRAINSVLRKNFFDLVNGYRIEKSKALLLAKKEKGLTLETIAEQCGFNSQVTYCNVFKKALGMTTTQWLKHTKKIEQL